MMKRLVALIFCSCVSVSASAATLSGTFVAFDRLLEGFGSNERIYRDMLSGGNTVYVDDRGNRNVASYYSNGTYGFDTTAGSRQFGEIDLSGFSLVALGYSGPLNFTLSEAKVLNEYLLGGGTVAMIGATTDPSSFDEFLEVLGTSIRFTSFDRGLPFQTAFPIEPSHPFLGRLGDGYRVSGDLTALSGGTPLLRTSDGTNRVFMAVDTIEAAPVPIPASVVLLCSALVTVSCFRRKRG